MTLFPEENSFIFIVMVSHFVSLLFALIFLETVWNRAAKSPLKWDFITVHVMIIIWLAGKILKTVSPILLLRWSSNVFYYAGIVALGPAFLLFTRSLLAMENSRKFRIALYLPSLILFLCILTNPLHFRFYSRYDFLDDSFGPLFYVLYALTHIFFTISSFLLVKAALKLKDMKGKTMSLLAGALVPLGLNLGYILQLYIPLFDITPIVYNFSLIVLGCAAFFYDFFSFIPHAVSSSLNALPGMIVLDDRSFGRDLSVKDRRHEEYSGSIRAGKRIIKVHRYIDMEAMIANTEHLQENILKIRNRNDQLRRETEKRLDMIRKHERLRLSGEIHDILGYSLSAIICLLESCRLRDFTPEEYRQKIRKALEITHEGMKELKDFDFNNAASSWKQRFFNLLSETEAYDLEYEFLSNDQEELDDSHYRLFFKILKESITNAVRYGNATRLTVALQILRDQIYFCIIDNGAGCAEILKGSGLKNMEKRIGETGGTISFFSEYGSGFHISIYLPRHLEKRGNSPDRKIRPELSQICAP